MFGYFVINSDAFGEQTGKPVANCGSVLEFAVRGCSVDINLKVNLGKWDELTAKAEHRHRGDDTLWRRVAVNPELSESV